MKGTRYILLLVLALLLASSVFIAQIAFRLERTLLSYGFTYREFQTILEPIDDPEIHAKTIREAFRFVRRQLSLTVPREIEDTILDSAVAAFSPSWVKQTVNLWLVTIEQVLHGKRDSLDLPLSMGPFKNAFMSAARGRFTVEEQMAIQNELDQVPVTIDLGDELPESVESRLVGVGRSMALLQVVLQYIIPGMLILTCFYHRRIGTGLVASGLGLVIGGVPAFFYTAMAADRVGRNAGYLLSRSLPSFAEWIGPGVGNMVSTVLTTGVLTAVLVLVSGLSFVAVGLYMVIVRHDPQIQLHGN